MHQLARVPGVINFTGGYPAAELINTRFFARALNQAVRSGASRVFHYDSPEGLPELQEALARLAVRAQIHASAGDVVVTTGGQQGLDIVARSLLAPGDTVVTERPTYFGALDVFRSVRANIVSVDLDHDGPRLDALAKALRDYRPKLLFLIPTFHNPTGITISLEKRRQILDLARRFGVAILEDDYCREMRYSGDDVPPLRALACDEDQVYYVRGMGKVYLPGMRVGFILGPREARSRLVATKGLTDLHTSCLLQQGLVNYLSGPGLDTNLSALRREYARRQRLFVDDLQRQLPEEVSVLRPDGGLHLWVTLPTGESAAQFYFAAVQRRVAFVMGEVFYADRQDHGTFRLSFGLNSPEQLAEGAARLAGAARDFLSVTRRRSAVIL
jgi:2-aminoadipate transaminase